MTNGGRASRPGSPWTRSSNCSAAVGSSLLGPKARGASSPTRASAGRPGPTDVHVRPQGAQATRTTSPVTRAAPGEEDWRLRAACRGRGDLWLSSDPVLQAIAAEGCRTCPVLAECAALADELAAALGRRERLALPGVWAGRVRGRPVAGGGVGAAG